MYKDWLYNNYMWMVHFNSTNQQTNKLLVLSCFFTPILTNMYQQMNIIQKEIVNSTCKLLNSMVTWALFFVSQLALCILSKEDLFPTHVCKIQY